MSAYRLTTVQELVAAGKLRMNYQNTVVEVCDRLKDADPDAEAIALDLIRQVLGSLTVNNLSKKPWPALGKRPAMDEYGVRDGQGRSWYVKFSVQGDLVFLHSFHQPLHDMDTVGGPLPR